MIAALLGAVGIGAAFWWTKTPPTEELLREARTAFHEKRYSDAERIARTILDREGASGPALLLAAQSADAQGNEREAIAYLKRIPAESAESPAGADLGARLAMQAGRARDAELFLRRVLKQQPNSLDANNQLAYLLGVEGRSWEARPFLLKVVELGRPTVHHLVMLSAAEPVIRDQRLLDRFRKARPDDPIDRLGPARTDLFAGHSARSVRTLERIVNADSQLIEAQAQLGLVLANSGDDRFLDWHASLPESANRHPGVWAARGVHAQRAHEMQVAARCFWEAVKRDPNDRAACYQLARILHSLKKPELAAPFQRRASRLRRLASAADRAFASPRDPELLKEAAQLTESLGRFAEAAAWAGVALSIRPNLDWANKTIRRLRLERRRRGTRAERNPADLVSLANYPLPKWGDPGRSVKRGARMKGGGRVARIRFHDDAGRSGLNFTYYNGARRDRGGQWIIESMGGGVAVLDYDADDRPDLYFTQGTDWPIEPANPRRVDALFRNAGGGRFENVTASAGLGDADYSHGCTVGDFDADGFADVYVANVGRNRLFRNNGDGTFTDAGDEAGLNGRRWTTSCLLADLNGDGLADVYDVNYLKVDLNAMVFCRFGSERSLCGPSRLAAESDRILLNLGDGRFRDATTGSGFDRPNGKGLGILAADLAGTGRLDVFVANDTVPNFLFRRTSSSGDPPRFQEKASALGVALDGEGLPQACMGVAAGDANGDGRCDLFITNYAGQSNTLYLQNGTDFTDATRAAGLRGPSFASLGFGTQFLDADLDGRPDLVIANGHVYGPSAAMRPQLFHNRGHARFQELTAKSAGAYFGRKHVGRGLARLDWNRDGRPDFVVSHVNAPAALLTNRTIGCGNYLAVQLRGVRGDRDAIGAVVTAYAGDRHWSQQLTAGDGYQAGNQRELIFGLGSAKTIDRLTVRWLNGTTGELRRIPANRRVLLIEGRNGSLHLP